jgi:hypothetical protein
MSDGKVRKWVRKFNEGRDNVHEEQHMICLKWFPERIP